MFTVYRAMCQAKLRRGCVVQIIDSRDASAAVARAYMKACYGTFITGPGQLERPRKQLNMVKQSVQSPMSTASCNPPLTPGFDMTNATNLQAYVRSVGERMLGKSEYGEILQKHHP